MSFQSKNTRHVTFLALYREASRYVEDEPRALSDEERQALADNLRAEPKVESFLERHPNEADAVLADIINFVDFADRKLAHQGSGIDDSKAPEDTVGDARLALLNARREQYRAELLERLDRYEQVAEELGPFAQYLGGAWDLSSGELHPSVFDIWKQSERINREALTLRNLAALLGRLDEARLQAREQWLEQLPAPVTIFKRAGPSTLVGVHESDDLANVISSEIALLSTPEAETLFYLKLAEKKLLTYDLQMMHETQPHKSRRKSKRLEKGPMILAIDTSGSMASPLGTLTKEMQAKAFALSLMRIAFQQRRSVHVILFSTGVRALAFHPPRASMRDILNFLMLSYHGGTSIGDALDAGMAVLEEDAAFRQADLMFLTDGDTGAFEPKRVAIMSEARARGIRFYGLIVGATETPRLFQQLDHVWRFDGHNLAEIAADLEQYRRDPGFPVRNSA
jgi:uncharacterized protein with von Willebrand factor type A (vWA) domain